MPWSSEEREKLIHFPELLGGNRVHAAFSSIGRSRYDISMRWIDSSWYRLINYTRKLKEIHNILGQSTIWMNRLYEIGIIPRDSCYFMGLPGIISRPTKMWIDARLLGHEWLLFPKCKMYKYSQY